MENRGWRAESGRGSGHGAQRGSLGRAAEVAQESRIGLADGRQVQMVRWQALLTDREGMFKERLGLDVAAGGPVEQGENVQALGDVGMVRRQRFLADREGALEKRLGLGIAAGVQVK